jgi:hypothetical protein
MTGPVVARRVVEETESSLRSMAARLRKYGPSAHTAACPTTRFWHEQALQDAASKRKGDTDDREDPYEFASGPWRDSLVEARTARQYGVNPPLSSAMPSGRTRRAISALLANEHALRHDPPAIGRRVDLSTFPSLTPPLPAGRVATILNLFNRLQRNAPRSELSLFEIDIWVSEDNDTISESLFLPLIMTLIDSRRRDHLDAFEFVAWVDMLCVLSEREIMRWVFHQMATLKPGAMASLGAKDRHARSGHDDDEEEAAAARFRDAEDDDAEGGVAGRHRGSKHHHHLLRHHHAGPAAAGAAAEGFEEYEDPLASLPPAIVLSQLPLRFKELARAHEHVADPNLAILKELQKRARHNQRSVGAHRTQRDAVFSRLQELGIADSLGVSVSSELLFEEDFFAAMSTTPQSFFPLQYLRTHVQNETFSPRFWTARRFKVLNWVDAHRTAVFEAIRLGRPAGSAHAIFPVHGGWGLKLHHPSIMFLLSPMQAVASSKKQQEARATAREEEESDGDDGGERRTPSKGGGGRYDAPVLDAAHTHTGGAALGVSPTQHLTIQLAATEGAEAEPDMVVEVDAGRAEHPKLAARSSSKRAVAAAAVAAARRGSADDLPGGVSRQLMRAHSESRAGNTLTSPTGGTPMSSWKPAVKDDGAGVGGGGGGSLSRIRRQSSPAFEKTHHHHHHHHHGGREGKGEEGPRSGDRHADGLSFGRMATALDRRAHAVRAQVIPELPELT